MNKGGEKRRSFRIIETVYLKYEVISEDEFRDGLGHRKLKLGRSDGLRSRIIDMDARLVEKMFLLKSGSKAAYECISLLNEKVNSLIDHLPELRESKAALARGKAQTCELGAEGMAFATNEPLVPGTFLHLRFLLESDSRYVETFCRVVREVEPPGDDTPGQHGVAVEFHGLKDAEKEILIQHLFSKESETLRMRRLEIDEAS